MQTAAPSGGSRPRSLRRPILVAAVVVAATVAVAVLSRPRDQRSASSAPLAPITGVVWKDPRSTGTAVFTDDTMRLFDGCQGEVDRLRVTDGSLVQGHRIGLGIVCSPAPGPGYEAQQRRLDHFYAVMAGPAAWSLSGDVLTLTTPGKGTLHLTTGGTGGTPMLVGTSWRLTYFSGPYEYERPAPNPLELIVDPSGSFTAGLGCGALTGTASVSPQSIRFVDVSPTPAGCASTLDAPGRIVFDLVTAGRATYAIRINQLIISGQGEMLVYTS